MSAIAANALAGLDETNGAARAASASLTPSPPGTKNTAEPTIPAVANKQASTKATGALNAAKAT